MRPWRAFDPPQLYKWSTFGASQIVPSPLHEILTQKNIKAIFVQSWNPQKSSQNLLIVSKIPMNPSQNLKDLKRDARESQRIFETVEIWSLIGLLIRFLNLFIDLFIDLFVCWFAGGMAVMTSTLVETVSINCEDFSESFLTCSTCLCTSRSRIYCSLFGLIEPS